MQRLRGFEEGFRNVRPFKRYAERPFAQEVAARLTFKDMAVTLLAAGGVRSRCDFLFRLKMRPMAIPMLMMSVRPSCRR